MMSAIREYDNILPFNYGVLSIDGGQACDYYVYVTYYRSNQLRCQNILSTSVLHGIVIPATEPRPKGQGEYSMKKLFEPHKIRDLTLKNRICVPPMVNYHWAKDDGMATEQHIDHYTKISLGGNGLIIQEAACISSDGRWVPSQLGLWNDGHIENMIQITKAVHNTGGIIFAQIQHSGVRSFKESVGPSVYTLPGFFEAKTSRPLTVEEIEAIQNQYADAALRAKKAGYDGVELHGTHGYLLSNFFNYNANRRQDRYGQDVSLFAFEIIRKIRASVGENYIVGIRIGGFEPTLEAGVSNALRMVQAGADFLDVSFGEDSNPVNVVPKEYPFEVPIYAAQEIKKRVSVPVFGVYRITNPALAERILQSADLDMVDIGRGVLVNPNWANDAKEGRDVGCCLDCKICQWRVDAIKRCQIGRAHV